MDNATRWPYLWGVLNFGTRLYAKGFVALGVVLVGSSCLEFSAFFATLDRFEIPGFNLK